MAGDGLKVGAEMVGAFHDDDLHGLGLNADHAQQGAVEQLLLATDHGHADAVDVQTGAVAQSNREATHHFARQGANAIADGHHFEATGDRLIAVLTGEGGHRSPQRQFQRGAHARLAGLARGFTVVHQAQGDLPGKLAAHALLQQGVQHAGGVAVAARAGIVLGVGNDHRPIGFVGQGHGALGRLLG